MRREPIKVGDLVKFKHHMFDEHQPVFLVTEAWDSADKRGSQGIKVHGLAQSQRGVNFVIVSRVSRAE